jgi:hypothetical protein
MLCHSFFQDEVEHPTLTINHGKCLALGLRRNLIHISINPGGFFEVNWVALLHAS